jgi:Na+-driven multidrug efflux pump
VIPLFAMSASIGPFVGQNWGAGLYARANEGMMTSFLWSMLWGLGVAVLFFLFGNHIGGLFEANPAVIGYASLYLAIVPFSYGTWGVLMMASATFNPSLQPPCLWCACLCFMYPWRISVANGTASWVFLPPPARPMSSWGC